MPTCGARAETSNACPAVDRTIWRALERTSIDAGNIHCRLAFSSVSDRIYCAIDRNRKRYFLIATTPEDGLEASSHSGLSANTQTMWQGGRLARFIGICCESSSLHDFFDHMGASLAQELLSADPPSEVVRRELSRWRRFWSDLPSPLLTREEQLGLFAELWFLHVWLFPRIGPAQAVERWRGPFSARHDFEWPSRAVEVKRTTSQRGRIHHINGLDQLKPAEGGRLFLFSVKLRETGSAQNSLPLLIEACRQPLANDPDAISTFENALARFGYSSAHDETYAAMTLEVSGELLFEVTEGFPRLTSETISAAALAGIEHLEYDLNLSSYESLAFGDETAIAAALE